jgi:hypothetical protein
MKLATLAIQAEAWLQEELCAQRALHEALARTERAARSRDGDLAGCEPELRALLVQAAPRDARRRALLARLASVLSLPVAAVTLTRVTTAVEVEGLDGTRLAGLRAELRAVAASVVRTARRLSVLARVHRELFEELCTALQNAAGGQPAIVDAEA